MHAMDVRAMRHKFHGSVIHKACHKTVNFREYIITPQFGFGYREDGERMSEIVERCLNTLGMMQGVVETVP